MEEDEGGRRRKKRKKRKEEEEKEEEEEEEEEDKSSDKPKKIEEGSIVVWTKNGEDFEGEVIKITPKKYKICCKPGKNKNDKDAALYMVSKDIVKLK
mgnify:CR=1 FL=1